LLGNIILQVLEKAGIPVENKVQLRPTKIVRTALLAGEVDIYPEYTGNAGFFFGNDGDPAWKNSQQAYDMAKRLDAEKNKLVWLQPATANNTWAIAVRKDVANANKLVTLEDFGRLVTSGGKVKLAGSAEFVESAAALPAFQSAYGFTLGKHQLLVLSGRRIGRDHQGGRGADLGRQRRHGLWNGRRAGRAWPRRAGRSRGRAGGLRARPVVRAPVLEKNPKIRDLLDPVFKTLTLETLQGLNAKIAVEGQDARKVARDYLVSKGFLG
jgi:osmoprotectant transport system substrate-binding protein